MIGNQPDRQGMNHLRSGCDQVLLVQLMTEPNAKLEAARVKVVVASVMQPMAEYRFAPNVV